MGWESRGGARRYYTRSKRVAGRVVREYVGTGSSAELAAKLDAARRAARAERIRAGQADRARMAAVEEATGAVDAAIDTLLRASLVLAGYHRHHRGEWRRRRGDGQDEGVGNG